MYIHRVLLLARLSWDFVGNSVLQGMYLWERSL